MIDSDNNGEEEQASVKWQVARDETGCDWMLVVEKHKVLGVTQLALASCTVFWNGQAMPSWTFWSSMWVHRAAGHPPGEHCNVNSNQACQIIWIAYCLHGQELRVIMWRQAEGGKPAACLFVQELSPDPEDDLEGSKHLKTTINIRSNRSYWWSCQSSPAKSAVTVTVVVNGIILSASEVPWASSPLHKHWLKCLFVFGT
jgi:hypothetical protein